MNEHLAAHLETADCPLCQSTESEKKYRGSFKPFGLRRCRACRCYFLSPRLSETAMREAYVKGNYFLSEDGTGYADYEKQALALRMTFRRVVKNLARRGLTGGSLLEIGCGHGYLLQEAGNHFETQEATEFSADAAAVARQYASDVFVGGVEAVPEARRYDLIIATHVIEHIYRPVEFLDQVWSRLRPGGHVMIAAPDMGSFWRRFMGRRWPSFKLPEHVIYFDRGTLSASLARGGFSEVTPFPYPHAFPLPLVASKLGIRIGSKLSRHSLWIPRTTVAVVARRDPAS